MAELPSMPFYPGDYMADTPHLTTQEHGAYMLLLMTYWMKGEALPDDDKRLARIVKLSLKEWLVVRETLEEFFIIDGVWQHKRIELDLAHVRQKVEKARAAGRASAKRRLQQTLNARSNGRATDVQRTHQPAKAKAKSITPLPPQRKRNGRPDPSDDRASDADVARPIGKIIEGLKP